MIDLEALQRDLDSNLELRKELQKNPAKVLQDYGFKLNTQQIEAIESQVIARGPGGPGGPEFPPPIIKVGIEF